MVSEKHDALKELKSWLSGASRVVVAGIGNPIRMDDFIGMKIVQDMKGKVSSRIILLECETIPENFAKPIVDFNPTHVLLIDAADLGLKPGEITLLGFKDLENSPPISTHMLPLRVFCQFITDSTAAEVKLLLIQPEQTDFGEGLSQSLLPAISRIEDVLLRCLPKN